MTNRSRRTWAFFLDSVKRCHRCSSQPKVRAVPNARAWTGFNPPNPARLPRGEEGKRVLFLSEAPPGGSQTFFWRDPHDRLRKFLFEAIRAAGHTIGGGQAGLADFVRLGCYLLPSFSYPCGTVRSGSVVNAKPNREMLQHSAKVHLAKAIPLIKPTDVVLLGESAVVAGMALGLKSYPTYWPTNRSGHLRDTVSTIRQALP